MIWQKQRFGLLAAWLIGLSSHGGEKAAAICLAQGDATNLAIVDFAPTSKIKGDIKRQFILTLYAKNGKSLSVNMPFMARGNVPTTLCTTVEACLREYGWNYTRKEDRLTITSYTDDKGRTWPITKISITDVKDITQENLPAVTVGGKVKLERGDKAPPAPPPG